MMSDTTTNPAATSANVFLTDPVLDIGDVARLLKVDAQAVRYLHRMRRLRGRRVGRGLRWRLSTVNKYVEKHL